MKKLFVTIALLFLPSLLNGCSKQTQTFTITWLNFDNTLLSTTKVKKGALPEYKGAFPRKSEDREHTYSFAGWSPEIAKAEQDTTYTATYDTHPRKYSIMWKDSNTGFVLDYETYEYGQMPSYKKSTPTKSPDKEHEYPFSGWFPELHTVYQDETYTALYDTTIRKYKVTWLDNIGNLLDVSYFSYGEMPFFSGEIEQTKEDKHYVYQFDYWMPELSKVTCDITYRAHYSYSPRKYNVVWKNYDSSILLSSEYTYGDIPSYDAAVPEKPKDDNYYVFIGWDKSIEPVTQDVEYTAVFDIGYKVTWVNYNGDILSTDYVRNGSVPNYNKAIPTKETDGTYTYSFLGWSPELSQISQDMVYYAQFTPKIIFELEENDGEYTIKDCLLKDAKYVSIPDSINGLKITRISAAAFESCTELQSLVLPSCIKNIEEEAFKNCNDLVNIYIRINSQEDYHYLFEPYSNTFKNYKYIKHLVDSSDEEIKEIHVSSLLSALPDYAFANYQELKGITISTNITSIGSNAFENCKSLLSIDIPETVTNLREKAFYNCEALVQVKLSKNLDRTYSYFQNCISLKILSAPAPHYKIKVSGYNYYSYSRYYAKFCSFFSDKSDHCYPGYPQSSRELKTTDTVWGVVVAPPVGPQSDSTNYYIPVSLEQITITSQPVIQGYNQKDNQSYMIDEFFCLGGQSGYIGIKNVTLDFEGSLGVGVWKQSKISMSINSSRFENIYIKSNVKIRPGACLNAINIIAECNNGTLSSFDGYFEGITTYGNLVFVEAGSDNSLTDITLTDCLVNFFYGDYLDTTIETIHLTNMISDITIKYNPFANCLNLKRIIVDDDDDNISSNNGVLFASASSLVAYPASRPDLSYEIPEDINYIKEGAFNKCKYLEHIVVHSNVVSSFSIFTTCENLSNIFYKGTESQIRDDQKEYDEEYGFIIYYYSETEPATDGHYWHYVNGEPIIWTA